MAPRVNRDRGQFDRKLHSGDIYVGAILWLPPRDSAVPNVLQELLDHPVLIIECKTDYINSFSHDSSSEDEDDMIKAVIVSLHSGLPILCPTIDQPQMHT